MVAMYHFSSGYLTMVGLGVRSSQTAHAVELPYSFAFLLMQLSARIDWPSCHPLPYHGRLRRFSSQVGHLSRVWQVVKLWFDRFAAQCDSGYLFSNLRCFFVASNFIKPMGTFLNGSLCMGNGACFANLCLLCFPPLERFPFPSLRFL